MTPQLQRYQRTGLLAIEPHAFMELFALVDAPPANQQLGRVAVVEVFGPLDGPGTTCWDSYSAIRTRMAAACASDATAIVLRVNSPGGDVAGCVDAARALRSQALAANKPLYAYVDAKACSAAYVLAAAAGQISVSSCALLGSIGVVSRRDDFSAANTARGLRVEFITSGARKSDGSPDVPITDGELAAQQAIVDTTASVLFATVAELRPNLTADQLIAMQAAIYVGDSAVSNGLADQVEPFEALLARIEMGGTSMASPYEKALAALQEAVKGKDANASAAKKALAALTAGDDDDKDGGDKDAPPADDDSKDKPKDDQAASDNDGPADDDKKAAAAPAAAPAAVAASANDVALRALAEVHKLKAERAAEKLAAERTTLLASRPDFSAEMQAVLATADIETVRKMVADLPRVTGAAAGAQLSAVAGTRGVTQGGSADQIGSGANRDLDRAMGLIGTTLGVERRGQTLVFGLREAATDKPAAAKDAAGGAK